MTMEERLDHSAEELETTGLDNEVRVPPEDGEGKRPDMFFEGRDQHQDGPAPKSVGPRAAPGQRSSIEFDFREYALNPLVEASSGLLALFFRLQNLEVLEDPHGLRARVAEEIRRIEAELETMRYVSEVDDSGRVVGRRIVRRGEQSSESFQSGELLYDFPVINALKYCLCTMIDEGVMSNEREEIGNNPAWRQESLLSEFHNETWGGEKVFLIKDRLMREPEKYKDFLEFLYLAFTLGYRGKYRVAYSGAERFERVVAELYAVIREMRGECSAVISQPLINRKIYPEHIRPTIPPLAIMALFALIIAGMFGIFWLQVENDVQNVLVQIEGLLASTQDNNSLLMRQDEKGLSL